MIKGEENQLINQIYERDARQEIEANLRELRQVQSMICDGVEEEIKRIKSSIRNQDSIKIDSFELFRGQQGVLEDLVFNLEKQYPQHCFIARPLVSKVMSQVINQLDLKSRIYIEKLSDQPELRYRLCAFIEKNNQQVVDLISSQLTHLSYEELQDVVDKTIPFDQTKLKNTTQQLKTKLGLSLEKTGINKKYNDKLKNKVERGVSLKELSTKINLGATASFLQAQFEISDFCVYYQQIASWQDENTSMIQTYGQEFSSLILQIMNSLIGELQLCTSNSEHYQFLDVQQVLDVVHNQCRSFMSKNCPTKEDVLKALNEVKIGQPSYFLMKINDLSQLTEVNSFFYFIEDRQRKVYPFIMFPTKLVQGQSEFYVVNLSIVQSQSDISKLLEKIKKGINFKYESCFIFEDTQNFDKVNLAALCEILLDFSSSNFWGELSTMKQQDFAKLKLQQKVVARCPQIYSITYKEDLRYNEILDEVVGFITKYQEKLKQNMNKNQDQVILLNQANMDQLKKDQNLLFCLASNYRFNSLDSLFLHYLLVVYNKSTSEKDKLSKTFDLNHSWLVKLKVHLVGIIQIVEKEEELMQSVAKFYSQNQAQLEQLNKWIYSQVLDTNFEREVSNVDKWLDSYEYAVQIISNDNGILFGLMYEKHQEKVEVQIIKFQNHSQNQLTQIKNIFKSKKNYSSIAEVESKNKVLSSRSISILISQHPIQNILIYLLLKFVVIDSSSSKEGENLKVNNVMEMWSNIIDNHFNHYFEDTKLIATLQSLIENDSRQNNILSSLDWVLNSGEMAVKAFDVNMILGERIYKFDIYLLDIVDGKAKLFTIMYVKLDEKEYQITLYRYSTQNPGVYERVKEFLGKYCLIVEVSCLVQQNKFTNFLMVQFQSEQQKYQHFFKLIETRANEINNFNGNDQQYLQNIIQELSNILQRGQRLKELKQEFQIIISQREQDLRQINQTVTFEEMRQMPQPNYQWQKQTVIAIKPTNVINCLIYNEVDVQNRCNVQVFILKRMSQNQQESQKTVQYLVRYQSLFSKQCITELIQRQNMQGSISLLLCKALEFQANGEDELICLQNASKWMTQFISRRVQQEKQQKDWEVVQQQNQQSPGRDQQLQLQQQQATPEVNQLLNQKNLTPQKQRIFEPQGGNSNEKPRAQTDLEGIFRIFLSTNLNQIQNIGILTEVQIIEEQQLTLTYLNQQTDRLKNSLLNQGFLLILVQNNNSPKYKLLLEKNNDSLSLYLFYQHKEQTNQYPLVIQQFSDHRSDIQKAKHVVLDHDIQQLLEQISPQQQTLSGLSIIYYKSVQYQSTLSLTERLNKTLQEMQGQQFQSQQTLTPKNIVQALIEDCDRCLIKFQNVQVDKYFKYNNLNATDITKGFNLNYVFGQAIYNIVSLNVSPSPAVDFLIYSDAINKYFILSDQQEGQKNSQFVMDKLKLATFPELIKVQTKTIWEDQRFKDYMQSHKKKALIYTAVVKCLQKEQSLDPLVQNQESYSQRLKESFQEISIKIDMQSLIGFLEFLAKQNLQNISSQFTYRRVSKQTFLYTSIKPMEKDKIKAFGIAHPYDNNDVSFIIIYDGRKNSSPKVTVLDFKTNHFKLDELAYQITQYDPTIYPQAVNSVMNRKEIQNIIYSKDQIMYLCIQCLLYKDKNKTELECLRELLMNSNQSNREILKSKPKLFYNILQEFDQKGNSK